MNLQTIINVMVVLLYFLINEDVLMKKSLVISHLFGFISCHFHADKILLHGV